MNRFFGEQDVYYFHHGTHYELYEKMGAHIVCEDGIWGVHFVLWAPNARAVCVISDGNGWTHWVDNMVKVDDSIWELFLPGMNAGTRYKYRIVQADGTEVDKIDPFGFRAELRPSNASVVCDLDSYRWNDHAHMEFQRSSGSFLERPMAVYEVHLGSWKRDHSRRDPADPQSDAYLDYRTLAHQLADYMEYMGYTHIELMGICEYPFDPSWGYQVTGYFAPTARYGSPEDFMYFVDYMHRRGFGVILDWVPAHFPKDSFGLANFDGTPLYEYADPLRAEYPEWGTKAFDLSKPEVSNFLIASAFFWVRKYHIDGLRVDAVASMLYVHAGRTQWRPNKDGGLENYESFEFFRHLSSQLHERTNALLIAEDSSILPGITLPASEGGLGFDLKWNMGWMNDTLRYYKTDPIYRRYNHNLMTHTLDYVFLEHFILVLSHDEVVYGKGSMYNKMPGNYMDKLGNLKSCYTMMIGHPGKKLLFMGQDFGQINEWNFMTELDWYLADEPAHKELKECFRALLSLYKNYPVLHNDAGNNTFEWIQGSDAERSIFTFIRRNPWNYNGALIFVCNFTPVLRDGYAVGVPVGGEYKRVFGTYSDMGWPMVKAEERLCDGRPYALQYNLRPYESVVFEVPCYEEKTECAEEPAQQETEKDELTAEEVKKTVSEPEIPSDIPQNTET